MELFFSQTVIVNHKEVEYASEKHQNVPYDVEIRDMSGTVEEKTYRVGNAARKQHGNTAEAYREIIGIDGGGNGPARDDVERHAHADEFLYVNDVEHKAHDTAHANKSEEGIAHETTHGGEARGGVGAEDQKKNERVVTLLGKIAEGRRGLHALDSAGGVEAARRGVQ